MTIDYREYANQLQLALETWVNTGVPVNRRAELELLVSSFAQAAVKASGEETSIRVIEDRVMQWLAVVGNSEETQIQRQLGLEEIRNAMTNLIAKSVGVAGESPERLETTTSQRLQLLVADHFGRVLTACEVVNWPHVYVLGCFDQKRTILTQQERAIWMAGALVSMWNRPSPPSVAIIGGGIAGLTAAAGLHLAGASVTLLERTGELMSLQRRNTTRYVHPNMYEWPQSHAIDSRANLPFLSWHAGVARNVVAQIEAGAKEIFSGSGWEPKFHFVASELYPISSSGNGRRYGISDREGRPIPGDGFDIIIIAIGFGFEEARKLGIRCPSYWDNEALHEPGRFTMDDRGQLLVSGAGDGGLIDVLRGTFRDFEQSSILDMLPWLKHDGVARRLLAIEAEAKTAYRLDGVAHFMFNEKYNEIIEEFGQSEPVVGAIESAYRVTFNARNPGLYSLNSSILNRIAVQFLVKKDLVSIRTKSIDHDMIMRNHDRHEKLFSVNWRDTRPRQGYDRIILRHGVSSDHFQEKFPHLFTGCAHIAGHLAALDLPTVLPTAVAEVIRSGFRI